MKSTLLTILLAAICFHESFLQGAPVVDNVTASQRSSGDRAVDISYDLSDGNGPMTVSILASDDNGATYAITPRSQYLSGDVGAGIVNGTGHSIVWDAVADIPKIYRPQTRIRIIATEENTVPEDVSIVITSNVLAPVHQTVTQTLTFTFGEGVTGFDATDVAITGATAGTFTPVSSTAYTLAVTGTGGTVTASVAAGAASSIANGAATLGGTFSNFYQDTWTLSLPGSVPMELIHIPAAIFIMGSPAGELSGGGDATQHAVRLTQDFYLGKTEVTQRQWLAIRGSWPGTEPSSPFGAGDNFPAYHVSHDDVQLFMADLDTAITEPATFSLPTESQWEYAARAGTTTRFNFGDGFGADELCSAEAERTNNMWYCGNSGSRTNPIAQKPANAWGLRDIHGNVGEWCSDWYGMYPTAIYPRTVNDPTGPVSGNTRVIRGGNWNADARDCRSSRRNYFTPGTRSNEVGFRVLAVR